MAKMKKSTAEAKLKAMKPIGFNDMLEKKTNPKTKPKPKMSLAIAIGVKPKGAK